MPSLPGLGGDTDSDGGSPSPQMQRRDWKHLAISDSDDDEPKPVAVTNVSAHSVHAAFAADGENTPTSGVPGPAPTPPSGQSAQVSRTRQNAVEDSDSDSSPHLKSTASRQTESTPQPALAPPQSSTLQQALAAEDSDSSLNLPSLASPKQPAHAPQHNPPAQDDSESSIKIASTASAKQPPRATADLLGSTMTSDDEGDQFEIEDNAALPQPQVPEDTSFSLLRSPPESKQRDGTDTIPRPTRLSAKPSVQPGFHHTVIVAKGNNVSTEWSASGAREPSPRTVDVASKSHAAATSIIAATQDAAVAALTSHSSVTSPLLSVQAPAVRISGAAAGPRCAAKAPAPQAAKAPAPQAAKKKTPRPKSAANSRPAESHERSASASRNRTPSPKNKVPHTTRLYKLAEKQAKTRERLAVEVRRQRELVQAAEATQCTFHPRITAYAKRQPTRSYAASHEAARVRKEHLHQAHEEALSAQVTSVPAINPTSEEMLKRKRAHPQHVTHRLVQDTRERKATQRDRELEQELLQRAATIGGNGPKMSPRRAAETAKALWEWDSTRQQVMNELREQEMRLLTRPRARSLSPGRKVDPDVVVARLTRGRAMNEAVQTVHEQDDAALAETNFVPWVSDVSDALAAQRKLRVVSQWFDFLAGQGDAAAADRVLSVQAVAAAAQRPDPPKGLKALALALKTHAALDGMTRDEFIDFSAEMETVFGPQEWCSTPPGRCRAYSPPKIVPRPKISAESARIAKGTRARSQLPTSERLYAEGKQRDRRLEKLRDEAVEDKNVTFAPKLTTYVGLPPARLRQVSTNYESSSSAETPVAVTEPDVDVIDAIEAFSRAYSATPATTPIATPSKARQYEDLGDRGHSRHEGEPRVEAATPPRRNMLEPHSVTDIAAKQSSAPPSLGREHSPHKDPSVLSSPGRHRDDSDLLTLVSQCRPRRLAEQAARDNHMVPTQDRRVLHDLGRKMAVAQADDLAKRLLATATGRRH
jgi:hypothetical protein